jgi:L-idonate 5-dehydrogenase
VVTFHSEAVEFRHLMAKELTLVGAMGYPTEFADALELVKSGRINLQPMISHRFAARVVLAVFEMAKQADRSAKVLVNDSG